MTEQQTKTTTAQPEERPDPKAKGAYQDRSMGGSRDKGTAAQAAPADRAARPASKAGDSQPAPGEDGPPIPTPDKAPGKAPKAAKAAKDKAPAKPGKPAPAPTRAAPVPGKSYKREYGDEEPVLMMVRPGRVLLWHDGDKRGDGGYGEDGTPNTVLWSTDPCIKQWSEPDDQGKRTVTLSFEHVLHVAPAGSRPTPITQHAHSGLLRSLGYDPKTGIRKAPRPVVAKGKGDKRRAQRGPMGTDSMIAKPEVR